MELAGDYRYTGVLYSGNSLRLAAARLLLVCMAGALASVALDFANATAGVGLERERNDSRACCARGAERMQAEIPLVSDGSVGHKGLEPLANARGSETNARGSETNARGSETGARGSQMALRTYSDFPPRRDRFLKGVDLVIGGN